MEHGSHRPLTKLADDAVSLDGRHVFAALVSQVEKRLGQHAGIRLAGAAHQFPVSEFSHLLGNVLAAMNANTFLDGRHAHGSGRVGLAASRTLE